MLLSISPTAVHFAAHNHRRPSWGRTPGPKNRSLYTLLPRWSWRLAMQVAAKSFGSKEIVGSLPLLRSVANLPTDHRCCTSPLIALPCQKEALPNAAKSTILFLERPASVHKKRRKEEGRLTVFVDQGEYRPYCCRQPPLWKIAICREGLPCSHCRLELVCLETLLL